MRIAAAAVLILFLRLFSLEAQEEKTRSGDLSFNLRSVSFFKNNEYTVPSSLANKSLWLEGYTLTGFWVQPELIYAPGGKVRIRAGGHFQKYSGVEGFSQARPVFSTSVDLTENTELTLGTLPGGYNHRLFDPHFNKEKLYNAYVEDGLQIKTVTGRIFNDLWISWENFIFSGDTEREIFTAGESFLFTSDEIGGHMRISVPVQIQFRHYGGQISNYPEPVRTFFNLATGLKLGFTPGEKSGTISAEYLHYHNRTLPGRTTDAIRDGNGSWIGMTYENGPFSFISSYWTARNFFAPHGNSIYASVFDFDSGYEIPLRKVLTNSLYLNFFPESVVKLHSGIDTYYDLRERKMDFAVALHLDLQKLIRIVKLSD